MNIRFPLLLSCAVVLFSCKKDNSGGSAPITYQPVTAGSTWNYDTENKIAGTTASYTLTATSTDTTINAKAYRIFNNSNGSKEYYYTDGNFYYQFGGIAGITENTELLFLKPGAGVGGTWSEAKEVNIPDLGKANVTVNYKLQEVLPSFTVGSNTFTDVVHVVVTLTGITVGGFPVPVASQDLHFYYAPGLGRVKSQVKITINSPVPGTAPINISTETNLKSANIK